MTSGLGSEVQRPLDTVVDCVLYTSTLLTLKIVPVL
jgi:Cu/Ag efflux pump CusA